MQLPLWAWTNEPTGPLSKSGSRPQPFREHSATQPGFIQLLIRCAVALLVISTGRAALAQTMYPAITDRNFSIDLFEQPALGSPRLIAMAGAIDSVAEGAAGLFTNPASASVRPETKADKFAWNVYFNSYVPAKGQDSDNNGQAVTATRRALLGSAGLLLQYGQWGLSL
ncbi:MAG TPA: hypothetical protein VG963_19690, partial [Polyangiaceae bacterium]|nr:hypothetical protein [Polyangiaceae bacterium]